MPALNFAPKSLDQFKTETVNAVNASAEAERLKYITGGAAQAMVYMQKEAEAKAYLADVSIDQSQIPHLVQEAAATNVTVAQLAQTIVTLSQQWRTVSAKIEAARQKALSQIYASTSPSAVISAGTINWDTVVSA